MPRNAKFKQQGSRGPAAGSGNLFQVACKLRDWSCPWSLPPFFINRFQWHNCRRLWRRRDLPYKSMPKRCREQGRGRSGVENSEKTHQKYIKFMASAKWRRALVGLHELCARRHKCKSATKFAMRFMYHTPCRWNTTHKNKRKNGKIKLGV